MQELPLQEYTATGNPTIFQTNVSKPLRELMIPFAPVQAGTGDPSPSNIRPIAGWTGMNIYQSGDDTSNPLTIPVSWQTEAGTVYGGMFDALTGVLTVGWKIAALNDPTQFYVNTSGYISCRVEFADRKKTQTSYDFFCSAFPAHQSTSGISYIRWASASSNSLLVIENGSDLTLEDVQSLSQNGDLAICYQLNTPYTVQLDPVTLSTLIGTNTIWTGTNGTNTVTYIKG